MTEVPYFCPVDSVHYDKSKISTRGMSEADVGEKLNFVSVNRVLRGMDESSNSLNNLLIVDACRNNPSKGKSAGIPGTSATVPSGINILYAASSGQKSWESVDKKNPTWRVHSFSDQGTARQSKKQSRSGDLVTIGQLPSGRSRFFWSSVGWR